MAKVKKSNLKKEAAAPEATEAPAKSPKMSPKMSPKISPKMSPKVAPAEPKKEAKKNKKEAEPKKEPKKEAAPEVSPEEKEKLIKEALEAIFKGIAKPESQGKGAFVPTEWNAKFKPVLGGYKKFCQGQTDKLQVVEMGANFLVLKAGDKVPAGASAKAAGTPGDWKSQLAGAWSAFCHAVPKHERSLEAFTASLPNGVKKTAPEGAAKTSPKMSPKAAPAPEPKAEGGKKRKAEAAAEAPAEEASKEVPPMKKKKKAKAA